MEEEKQETTETQEEPKEEPTMVQSAYEAAKNLREQNERMEKNIKRLEELKSFETLGGRADIEKPVEKKEISSVEYADSVLRGKIPQKE